MIEPGFEEIEDIGSDEIEEIVALHQMQLAGRAIARIMRENAELKLLLKEEKERSNRLFKDFVEGYDPNLVLKSVLAGMDMAERKIRDG